MLKRMEAVLTIFIITALKLMTFCKKDMYSLKVVHINDFHARYEPTEESGDPWTLHACRETGTKCIGGFGRTIYMVKRLVKEANDRKQPVVYLDAGDNFQGSLWYNAGRWNLTVDFLNMFPPDAMTLGNHEFEHGVPGLVPFLRYMRSPITVANMDISQEPSLNLIKQSLILIKNGRKIGIIGVIIETTADLQPDTGKVRFLDESTAIMREANKLKAQHINIIIVISHVGYKKDKIIAAQTGSLVDIIVGGHSHTFLYNEGKEAPGPMKPGGDYPTVIKHSSGKKVLIVQVGSFARYLGNLTVDFDDRGEIVSYSGAPIYLSAETPEDKEVIAKRPKWEPLVNKLSQMTIGSTVENLDASHCKMRECTLGNYYTKAILDKFFYLRCKENRMRSSNVSFAVVTGSGLFGSIPKGVITYNQIYHLAPYDVSLAVVQLQGRFVKQLLERSVSLSYDAASQKQQPSVLFLQISGLQITYDLKKAVNQRVVSIKIRCHKCPTPTYNDILPDKYYKVVTSRFVAHGGYGYTIFKTNGRIIKEISSEHEALMDYVKKYNPIHIKIENQIKFL